MKWLITLLLSAPLVAQNHTLPLWPDGVPNHNSGERVEKQEHRDILWVTQVQEPAIEVYLPTKRHATGTAILICPGGGYGGLAYDWEGTDIAKWLNSRGIAGMVLKYRLPSAIDNPVPNEAPLQDALQAMSLIREHAREWSLDPQRLGVMGFSAGGHLASTLGTHFNDDITRPDFMVLIYPVISMEEAVTHAGSRHNLLGVAPSSELVKKYSNETQVSSETPPTFLVHSTDDEAVKVANSLRFYQALLDAQVPSSELHIYPYGGHGYSLAIGQGRLGKWPSLMLDWVNGLVPSR